MFIIFHIYGKLLFVITNDKGVNYMAIPRIFISSTCYDLYDLRNNLREFIKSFDYEPVMSEFGDIFYDYTLHVQDACLKEIENVKCLFY
jgi:hypothetical protein